MKKKSILIAAACLLQVVILAVMVTAKYLPLATGREILLRVAPVDPRSLFRGQYVALSYPDLRPLDPGALETDFSLDTEFRRGDPFYVSLEQDGRYWKPVAIATGRPPEGLFIEGLLRYRWSGGQIDLKYSGIEAFFASPERALQLERMVVDRKVEAVVAVTSGGKVALKDLVEADESGR